MRKITLGAAAPLLIAASLMAQTTNSHAGAAAATANQPTPPAHPITTAQAHELMQLTGTDQIKTRLVTNIMNYFQERFPPFVPADVKTDLHDSLEKMDVETPTVATYKRYLSTEDATKVIAFYRTPAGKAFLTAEPKLLQEVQQSALKDGQQTVRTVIDRHKAEIQAAQVKYQKEHQRPSAPTLGPTGPATTKPGTGTPPKEPQ